MKKFYSILFFVLLVADFLIYKTIFAPQEPTVSILDVGPPAGGGDAILIRTPNRKTLLVDTGPDASILRALGTTLPEWQRNIDVIALTSPKTAATGGLPEVMSRYHVPTPLLFGTITIPYGTRITLDDVFVDILAPGTLNISYGNASLSISSTTPKGVYISDGKKFVRN